MDAPINCEHGVARVNCGLCERDNTIAMLRDELAQEQREFAAADADADAAETKVATLEHELAEAREQERQLGIALDASVKTMEASNAVVSALTRELAEARADAKAAKEARFHDTAEMQTEAAALRVRIGEAERLLAVTTSSHAKPPTFLQCPCDRCAFLGEFMRPEAAPGTPVCETWCGTTPALPPGTGYVAGPFYCSEACQAAGRPLNPPAATSPKTTGEPTYPCADCGKLRTKAEGGTTFTACDACWDKAYPEAAARSPKTEPGK